MMSGFEIDFSSRSFIDNPYSAYTALLDRDEPYWLPHVQRISTEGMWLFSRYEDVAQILRTPPCLSKQISRVSAQGQSSLLDMHMMNQDPPVHTRLRGLIEQAFTRRRIQQLEGSIVSQCDQLLDALDEGGETDFVSAFALPFPVLVIAKLMGVPQEDIERIRDWSVEVARSFDSATSDQESLMRQKQAVEEAAVYFHTLIGQRRSEPSDDLISALINAHDQDGELSTNELIAMCMLLLFAGHETTVNLISGGLYSLCRHPRQLALLKEDPELLPGAIEEMLRFETPLQRSPFRITVEDCEIGSKHLQAGEQVCAIIGAANRDPRQFDRPEQFNIRRTPNRHLAFGLGIHSCLGARLARTEALIGFDRLLRRFPAIDLASDEADWGHSSLFRRLDSLLVRL